MKTCCCTGNRPQKFPWKYRQDVERLRLYRSALLSRIERYAVKEDFRRFLTGMALGADLDFAVAVLGLRDREPKLGITLECALPCPDQTRYWNAYDRAVYHNVLTRANRVHLIGERYTQDCMHRRNRYMVDRADLILAVWNGVPHGGAWRTLRYAREQNKRIEEIRLDAVASETGSFRRPGND